MKIEYNLKIKPNTLNTRNVKSKISCNINTLSSTPTTKKGSLNTTTIQPLTIQTESLNAYVPETPRPIPVINNNKKDSRYSHTVAISCSSYEASVSPYNFNDRQSSDISYFKGGYHSTSGSSNCSMNENRRTEGIFSSSGSSEMSLCVTKSTNSNSSSSSSISNSTNSNTINQQKQQLNSGPLLVEQLEKEFHKHDLNTSFLANYVLGCHIGAGGFGFVYQAIRKSDRKEVAVKFIHKKSVLPENWRHDRHLGCVPIEVYIVKNVSHENIIKFIDFFEDSKFSYLVTEIHGCTWGKQESLSHSKNSDNLQNLPSPTSPSPFNSLHSSFNHIPSSPSPPQLIKKNSGDLFECIEQHVRFTEAQALFVFRQILSIVLYLNSIGVVHRDIKDENLLINENFIVKLIDFGSAAIIPLKGEHYFERFEGTPQYAAPEVIREGKYLGPQVEIWALGCCLHVMLHGDAPFEGARGAINGWKPSSKSHLSNDAKDLLCWMLHKSPSHRPNIKDVMVHSWVIG